MTDNPFRAFFDTRLLNPHGICLLWRPELLWAHAVSDGLIGLAYFSIPLVLGVFLYHRRDVRFSWAIWMFVAFIMLCGLTHFMSIWTLWKPDYGVEALVKVATAIASLITAVALWPLLPKVIAMPSTAALQARVQERDTAMAELRRVMATMVAMEEHEAQLKRLLQELAEKEAHLRSLFENAAVGIARVGLNGAFLEVNGRYAEIAGRSRDEMLAGGFQGITHPEDLDASLEHLQALREGRASRYSVEKRYVRADGSSVWVNLTASIVRDAIDQPSHLVAIAEDITEEKRLAETQLMLMREVDHRARNALTVVQAIVRLTDATDPERFKETVIGRVDALARAQSSLSRSSWEGALLEDVVAEELHAITSAEFVRLSGPSHMLRPEAVQPFGMLVHELATNAMKHGALSVAAGRVNVDWSPRPGGGWRLLWTERGGPQVSAPTRQGFGSRLIARLAAQLEGKVQFEWAEDGLRMELVTQPA